MQTKKTDNADLSKKLQLRRYFLDKYHSGSAGPVKVFETCQGGGHIWKAMSREYSIRSWGVDVKPKPGRLKVDAHRVLANGVGGVDVVDIDTYGEPWSMLKVFLGNHSSDVTLFLTWGMPGRAQSPSKLSRQLLGLPLQCPRVLVAKAFWRFGCEFSLGSLVLGSGFSVIEARVITVERGAARVRYIGARLKFSGESSDTVSSVTELTSSG